MQQRLHVPVPLGAAAGGGAVWGSERRHAGSSAIDWPTGVSKHCRSRPPITQHTRSSSEMCPSGSHRRSRRPAADPTQPPPPAPPYSSGLFSPRRKLFFPRATSRHHLRQFLALAEARERQRRANSELRCFAVIILIGCGTRNYLGPGCPVVTCVCVVRKQGRKTKFNSRGGRIG